jgi:sensor histidine kinase YesM
MTEIIWPLAVVAISTVFFLIFREPLSTLIKRTKSIGRDGLDATHELSAGTPLQLQDRQTDTITTLLEAHLAEIQRIEQRHTERYEKHIEPLKTLVEQFAQQIASIDSRLQVLESNFVVKRMLEAAKKNEQAKQTT